MSWAMVGGGLALGGSLAASGLFSGGGGDSDSEDLYMLQMQYAKDLYNDTVKRNAPFTNAGTTAVQSLLEQITNPTTSASTRLRAKETEEALAKKMAAMGLTNSGASAELYADAMDSIYASEETNRNAIAQFLASLGQSASNNTSSSASSTVSSTSSLTNALASMLNTNNQTEEENDKNAISSLFSSAAGAYSAYNANKQNSEYMSLLKSLLG